MRVLEGQDRGKKCPAAIFAPRQPDVSLGPLGWDWERCLDLGSEFWFESFENARFCSLAPSATNRTKILHHQLENPRQNLHQKSAIRKIFAAKIRSKPPRQYLQSPTVSLQKGHEGSPLKFRSLLVSRVSPPKIKIETKNLLRDFVGRLTA